MIRYRLALRGMLVEASIWIGNVFNLNRRQIVSTNVWIGDDAIYVLKQGHHTSLSLFSKTAWYD